MPSRYAENSRREQLIQFDINAERKQLNNRSIAEFLSLLVVSIVYSFLFACGLLLMAQSILGMFALSFFNIQAEGFEGAFSFGIVGGMIIIFLAHALYFAGSDSISKQMEQTRKMRASFERRLIQHRRL